jgi:ParB/RepB/Spo0J family partition protein
MTTVSIATAVPTEQLVPLASIGAAGNVRDLDLEHVDDLAASIALRGLISPLTVKPAGDGFQLVAGFHRHAACTKLGLDQVPVTLRTQEGTTADSAAENVLRKQLTPLEEARAVQAMLDDGYTLDGAASVLGWSRALVAARAKILDLPEHAQQLVGSGHIPVSVVDSVLAINTVSPELTGALAAAIVEGDVRGSDLRGNLGWVLGRAMGHAPKGTFIQYLNTLTQRDIEPLKLGKRATAQLEQAQSLHKQLDQYAYGLPTIRFTEEHVDQARAAGVLIEIEDAPPIIVDRPLYRELAKSAIANTVVELDERKQRKAQQQTQLRAASAARPRTPKDELDIEHRAQAREFARRAHGVNLDLGAALLNGLSIVDPADMDVARFFAWGLLGPERSNHLGSADNVARTLAANGIRVVLDEFRTTETPTLKSGKPGKTKVTYGEVDDAQAWLWKFVAGARTAGELYGRALVVCAAQHYALQIALPNSQRRGSVAPASQKDAARKALEKLVRPLLPDTYKQLTRAIAREAAGYRKSVEEIEQRECEGAARADADDRPDAGVDVDELAEAFDAEELADDTEAASA